jgi:hypothetical protein
MLRGNLALLLLLLLQFNLSQAQDLSGTWEGSGSGTAITIILLKCGDKYVGYEYDRDGFGFCKTNIEAVYDAATKKLKVTSKSFIDHTVGHSQTNFALTWLSDADEEQLRGTATLKGVVGKVLSLGLGYPVILKKISPQVDTTSFMRKALLKLPSGEQPPVVQVHKPVDTATVAPGIEKDQLLQASTGRKQVIIKTIATRERKITITVYDNGVHDGDSISIMCDSVIISSRLAVSLQPISFEIALDERSSEHNVILIAHNLGRIPPNTATVEIIAGAKKYTLPALSDLSSNAVIRFIYGDD